ncbi:alkaline phosphatase family protein [Rhodothermaceae bacterium RA]|nr:alkaline phosphatase family protein [Rhodothermaceae bacterium RA]
MNRTAVLNVVGLTPGLIGAETPFLSRWAAEGTVRPIQGVLPAVTCSVQATYLTGVWPETHGIVGNGWYFRDECEVKFWRQSNRLVQAPKVWEQARAEDTGFTCANLFWWYNMYSSVDVAVTPRPMYPADGRKLPDVYTWPPALRFELQERLGPFPLFEFWGPGTTIRSSQWIARAAMDVERRFAPTLSLVYLPHLDYNLQRLGPDDPAVATDLREIDAVCEELVTFYEERGVTVMLLSEYGITGVTRPVALNRVLREAGLITVREELGRELLDAGACEAFAVADHQVAHVYVNRPERLAEVRALLEAVPGVEAVLDEDGKRAHHLAHERAGELVAVAEPDAWFSYYYWLDDDRAPDFAPTVDIHRKPGYDPAELFLDPDLRFPRLRMARRLVQKKLGFRYLMDVIPLHGRQVRGSHGRLPDDPAEGPVLVTRQAAYLEALPDTIPATAVQDVILAHLRGQPIRQGLV